MVVGSKVWCKEKLYQIIWIYDNGYCEIKETQGNQIELVKMSDLSF
jgi:hypothetical protein